MPKRTPPMTTIHSWDEVPTFRSEAEEADWWSTHDLGEELLAEMKPAPLTEEERQYRRSRTRPVAVRFDESTLERMRALAARRNKGYQTLLKEFIVERLYEEEKREGQVTSFTPPSDASSPKSSNSAMPCEAIAADLDALDARTDHLDDVWHERPEALARLVERADAEHCEDLARRLRWEAMLAYAYTSNAALLERDRPRFVTFHPDLTEESALDYLATRADVASVHIRSRVQDFLWEHGGAARKRHATGAGAAYLAVADLEAANAAVVNFGWLRVGDAIVRAAELAKAANQRATVRAVADRALELLQRLSSEGNPRFVLDMGLALSEVARVLTSAEAHAVDGTLTTTSSSFLAEGNYHLARAAMDVRRRFAVARKQSEPVIRDIDLEIARSCLDEGEQKEREGSSLVASVAYNQALHLLERLGSEKQLTNSARAALRRTREAGIGQMSSVTTRPIKVSPEQEAELERVIGTVATATDPDCFRLIALHPQLRVSRADVQGAQRTMQEDAPLTQLFPQVILRSGGQALAPIDAAQAQRLALYQLAVRLVRIQDGLFLNDILERIIGRNDLGPDALLSHLESSGNVPLTSLPMIAVGVRRLWERDWVSALHILVPPLEEVMRSIMRRAGHDTMRTHKNLPGVTVEVPLGYVLDELSSVVVDDGVIFMLKIVLDLYGLNLRNQFCHGLANIGDCSINNAARILQLYLILCELRPSANDTRGVQAP
jgi:hypothetical protein